MSYFKPMSEEEFLAKKDEIFPVLDNTEIHNEQDIKNFLLSI